MGRACLYRHFDDGDRLLYVGISKSALTRLGQHLDKSHWSQQIARVAVEWFDSRGEAAEAELRAIRAERPLHNIAGTIGRPRDENPHPLSPDYVRPQVWPIPASHALIAWSYDVDGMARTDGIPAVAVGYLRCEDVPDWSINYLDTGGAANTVRREMGQTDQRLAVMRDYYMLVYTYGFDPHLVHRAFLNIQEFQDIIKEGGLGPDKGEPGHDPEVGYGRMGSSPELVVSKFWHSEHVFLRADWPSREAVEAAEA